MKNKLSIFTRGLWTVNCGLLALACGLWTADCHAQTFVSGLRVVGTTNAQLVVAGMPQTNSATVSFPAATVIVTSITDTNETIILSDAFQIAGYTNLFILGNVTNSFCLTNGGVGTGSWTNVFAARYYQVSKKPVVQAAIGAETNYIYYP